MCAGDDILDVAKCGLCIRHSLLNIAHRLLGILHLDLRVAELIANLTQIRTRGGNVICCLIEGSFRTLAGALQPVFELIALIAHRGGRCLRHLLLECRGDLFVQARCGTVGDLGRDCAGLLIDAVLQRWLRILAVQRA